EITSLLQRELVQTPAVFGEPVAGSPEEPSVYMESVHHIFKLVAGVPNPRPAWFFDVSEQGEALSDVGTHLVDLVQWTLFPGASLDHSTDTRIVSASHWPTMVAPEQFQAVTGQSRPETLEYYCNTRVNYALRGVHVKLDVLWNWEAPSGGGDTHLAVYRGTKARIEVRQTAAENFRPELFVSGADPVALRECIRQLQPSYPGIGLSEGKGEMRITIPDRYRVGHEAHFAQVTNQFLEYLKHAGTLPKWEKPNMSAKYFVTTKGVGQ